MKTNKPTLPQRIGFDSDDAADPDIYPEAPTWPPAGDRPMGPLGSDRFPSGTLGSPLLWLSLGATGVVLIGLLGLLLLNQLGVFAAGGATGPFAPGAALGSPTALPSPTITTSVNPLSGWLQVTPSSVRLGCDGDTRTQIVVLANTGPEDVQWQAVVLASGGQAGIAIDPNQGELHAGASVSVQLQNTTGSSGSHGNSSKQGAIRFAPTSTEAGPPASLSFTTERCH